MKVIFVFCFLFSTFFTSAQLFFPKGFQLVQGENLSGEDDIYTNGRYSFQTHQLFRAYDNYIGNDENFRKYVSEALGVHFYQTKDGLLWGTGRVKSVYSYIIVTWNGEAIELFSAHNDKEFSQYSKWLLNTLRSYHQKGKTVMFPMRNK